MKIINLKERYTDYYITKWKNQGLPLITERPPTTTEAMLEKFFSERKPLNQNKGKARAIGIRARQLSRLNYEDYLKEEYK